MREKLIRFAVSGNTLYITVSHLICDGAGFKQLVYLLYGGMDTGEHTDYTKPGVLDEKRLQFRGTAVKTAMGCSE